MLSLTDFPTFGHVKVYLLAGHNQAKFGQDIKRSSGLRPPKDCVHVPFLLYNRLLTIFSQKTAVLTFLQDYIGFPMMLLEIQ